MSVELNAIGVLRRREIEARILAPIIEALSQEFPRDRVVAIVRDAVIRLAREQGAELAASLGGCSLAHFRQSLEAWTKDSALELDVLRQDEHGLDFNVTRCRYAELYRSLGIGELGATLSCNRDFSLIEGFNPEVTLVRTQTLMGGASHCDFRYRLKHDAQSPET